MTKQAMGEQLVTPIIDPDAFMDAHRTTHTIGRCENHPDTPIFAWGGKGIKSLSIRVMSCPFCGGQLDVTQWRTRSARWYDMSDYVAAYLDIFKGATKQMKALDTRWKTWNAALQAEKEARKAFYAENPQPARPSTRPVLPRVMRPQD